MTWQLITGDALEVMASMTADSVDLVFGSPPYEDARTYGINFKLTGQGWVDWMKEFYREGQRICRGLVAFVLEGKTKDYRWSAVPMLLGADLHRAGFHLRRALHYHRVGIPGSGGPDWLRADTEYIICTARPGRLPWSDNTAMGHPPKWAPGGEMSYRLSSGERRNQWGNNGCVEGGRGEKARKVKKERPSHKIHTKAKKDGDETQTYVPPVLANPGNVIKCKVGGGLMGGDKFCSQNEAPFPEYLAEFMIRSFCQPGGIVIDPFSGSGTTVAVANRLGRHGIGIDIRQSQTDLATRRLESETSLLFTE